MLKSILIGSATGILLSGTAAVGLAMLFPAPAGNTPPAAPQMDVPIANVDPSGDRDVAALDVLTDQPKTEEAPAPQVIADTADDPQADSTPLDEPDVASVEETLPTPDSEIDVAISATTEEPVLPNPQSVAIQPPATETDIAISTDPAEVPAEPIVEVEPPTPVVVELEPVEDGEDVAMADDAATEPAEVEVEIDTNPSAQVTAPAVISIVTEDGQTMPAGNGAVQVNRPTEDPVEAEPADAEMVADADATVLKRFGTAFENPENKPLLSVVLFDRNEVPDATLSLSQLSFPVTIVIDPAADDALSKMRLYRDKGLEVAVMAELPEGATPADVEVILTGIFTQLPEAIALVDTGSAGLQANRDVIEQAMAVLADDGRGLLTISRGLNTALRAADEAGVPATTIYRDIDTEWQSSRIIRRFLDQSAFRARQESGVVLLGRLRPNTLTALKNWGRSSRAEQIMMAPLSAVLSAESN